MKAEGIYSWLSIYFPLWLTPEPGTSWLDGYDGRSHPFTALMFNPAFEVRYRAWWTALLTTPSPHPECGSSTSGRRGRGDPERGLLPLPHLRSRPDARGAAPDPGDPVRRMAGAALRILRPGPRRLERGEDGCRSGNRGRRDLDRGCLAPGGTPPRFVVEGRSPAARRPGRRARRDPFARESSPEPEPARPGTVRFLVEEQSAFYARSETSCAGPGSGRNHGLELDHGQAGILEPLEKMSYLEADFLDRHVYFDCARAGTASPTSCRKGTPTATGARFASRGRTVFRSPSRARPRTPDSTGGRRPCRRCPGPGPIGTDPRRLSSASYGAHQATDAIIHFALDSDRWSVQPRPFAQPWTLLSPGTMGQFPAAAMIFREGLVAPGDVVVRRALDGAELWRLEGAPWLFAEPLVYLAGRVDARFTDGSRELDRPGRSGTWGAGRASSRAPPGTSGSIWSGASS